MEKIFKLFGKEYESLNQAALLLGSFALISQVLGLLRDRLLAHFVGPSATLDIYYASFRIPDFIFISIASLASITVLIPFLNNKMTDNKVTAEARKFFNDVFTVFFSVIFLVSIFMFFLMPYLSHFIAPGFSGNAEAEMVTVSRIMLLSPILLGLSNLFGSVTQIFRKFFIYALSPIFYNIGIIIGILFFYPHFGVQGLAFGVVLGALAHFLVQISSSVFSGFYPKFSFAIDFVEITKVVLISLPRTLGLTMNNLALIVIIALASFLQAGSVSVFNLSFNLQSVPLNIIGISYAVAAFPTLAKSFSLGKFDEFKDHLVRAARAIVFWSIPITFIFIVVRAQIVRVVLGTPSFSWDNTRLVAASLAIFAVSILAQGMVALFSRAHYAKGNTRRPLLINFFSSVLIVVMAFVFTYIFTHSVFFKDFIESMLKVSNIKGTEILMLPLAYSFGTVFNFIVHWYFAKKEFMEGESMISKTFFQSLGASFFLGLFAYLSLNFLSPIFGTNTFLGIFFQGLISSIVGVAVGGIVLYILKNEELNDLLGALKTKFWKTKVIAPSQEGL